MMQDANKPGKIIIFSAPSGAGKTTIVQYLLTRGLNLEFSISATSRAPRGQEKDGKDYYFLSADEFQKKIEAGDFIEWEEVYSGTYYGSLKSEVDRITRSGNHIVFDVDVVGGLDIKQLFQDRALAMFIQPPSIEELEKRLKGRGTDTPEKIKIRLEKAAKELTYARQFDVVIVNDDLTKAQQEAEKTILHFLNQ